VFDPVLDVRHVGPGVTRAPEEVLGPSTQDGAELAAQAASVASAARARARSRTDGRAVTSTVTASP